MTSKILLLVQELYSSFDQQMIINLPKAYRTDVVFQDPLQRIEGLENLTRYYQTMLKDLHECRFEFSQVIENNASLDSRQISADHSVRVQQAVMFWTMNYRHKKLAGGKLLSITGNSHLKYQDKILYHRDYFDAGAMLYEQIPLLGFAIKSIKKRMEV